MFKLKELLKDQVIACRDLVAQEVKTREQADGRLENHWSIMLQEERKLRNEVEKKLEQTDMMLQQEQDNATYLANSTSAQLMLLFYFTHRRENLVDFRFCEFSEF